MCTQDIVKQKQPVLNATEPYLQLSWLEDTRCIRLEITSWAKASWYSDATRNGSA